jgi:hypothetical protein
MSYIFSYALIKHFVRKHIVSTCKLAGAQFRKLQWTPQSEFHTSYLASISKIADQTRKRLLPGISQGRFSGALADEEPPAGRPCAPGWGRSGARTAALMFQSLLIPRELFN